MGSHVAFFRVTDPRGHSVLSTTLNNQSYKTIYDFSVVNYDS